MKGQIEVEVLGSVSPYCLSGQACPSYYITDGKTKILLDAGSGSHRFFDMKNLSGLNIFISHLHRDHYNDIYNYQYSSMVLHGQGKVEEQVHIYLPEYESERAKDIINEPLTFSNYFEINESTHYSLGTFDVSFCEVEHTPQLKTYAMKIEREGKKIVYSADISFRAKDKFVEFAKGADLLICEASLLEEYGFPQLYVHLTASQAGKIAKEAGVKQLLITHLWPEEEKEKFLEEARKVFDNVLVATEQLKINVK